VIASAAVRTALDDDVPVSPCTPEFDADAVLVPVSASASPYRGLEATKLSSRIVEPLV
jgi:hypothetical protein